MPIRRRELLLAGASLPFLTACASSMAMLSQRPLSDLAQQFSICFASYALVRAGQVTELENVSGCTTSTAASSQASGLAIYQAASLSKPVVAYAALTLVLQGRLDLDAPISQYLPHGYQHFHSVLERGPEDAHDIVAPEALARVRVAQLLQHSSGLPNWSSKALALEFEPGARWSYSGEGFMLLQAVLEAVTQRGLDELMQQLVFEPLGMQNSSMVWQPRFAAQAVTGTTRWGVGKPVQFHYAAAAASLYTTAEDYARFMAALLHNSTMLALVLREPIEADAALGLQWGLGWGIEQGPGGPYLWQWGNNPGFRAFAMASVASKDGFVLLTNNDRGMPLAASLARTVLPAEHKAFEFPWVA